MAEKAVYACDIQKQRQGLRQNLTSSCIRKKVYVQTACSVKFQLVWGRLFP